MTAGRVLVVDDEESIRELCRVNLELHGYEVLEAPDGVIALEIVARERPDVVFLDVMLPRLDGWEVLHRIKSDPELAPIPVVMLTARTAEDDQMRGWEEGALDYVTKPFHPQTLADVAAEAMAPRDPSEVEARRARVLEQLALVRQLRSARGG